MSYLNWKEIEFNNKQEARNAFVALVDYNMNGKTKHYDGITYLFRKLYPGKIGQYIYDIVEANQYGATIAMFNLRLDESTKKIYLKATDNNLRVELFFGIILNNIKEILANQTCFALNVSNINWPTGAYPNYKILYGDIIQNKAMQLDAYGQNFYMREIDFNSDRNNFITIQYTEDRKYAYVSISKKDKLIVKKLKKYFLCLYINYVKDCKWKLSGVPHDRF